MGFDFRFDFPPGGFKSAEDTLEQLAERLALSFTDRASSEVLRETRRQMKAANLGNLGNALAQTSDLKKGGIVKRRANGKFSASGIVYIRSRSQRSIGAIISYTEGAQIEPRRGDLLWIPTDEIRRRANVPLPTSGGGRGRANVRLTPSLWARSGLNEKIGRLQKVRSKKGTPLLIVKNVAVNAGGQNFSAKSRLKSGKAPKGFVNRDFIVAFVGIPNTSRAARILPRDITVEVTRQLLAQI